MAAPLGLGGQTVGDDPWMMTQPELFANREMPPIFGQGDQRTWARILEKQESLAALPPPQAATLAYSYSETSPEGSPERLYWSEFGDRLQRIAESQRNRQHSAQVAQMQPGDASAAFGMPRPQQASPNFINQTLNGGFGR